MPDRHVKYRGVVRELQAVENGIAILDNDEAVLPAEIEHPSYHPTLGLTAARTAASGSGGVMVAVRPPDALLHDLVATEAVTEDFGHLHITLAYFEEPDPEVVREVMRRWVEVVEPITLRLGGWGRFTPPEGDEVLYASIDSPGIDRWRNALLAICAQEGLVWSDKHGFQPHLTCAYVPEVVVPAVPPPSQEVVADTVVTTEGIAWTTWVVQAPELAAAAALHDEPEPALPRTDGAEADEGVDEEHDDMSLISQAAKAHLHSRQASMHASKQALRDFTPMEQRELIDEGAGRVRARNLSALNLDGTHYDPSVLDDDPEDLFG